VFDYLIAFKQSGAFPPVAPLTCLHSLYSPLSFIFAAPAVRFLSPLFEMSDIFHGPADLGDLYRLPRVGSSRAPAMTFSAQRYDPRRVPPALTGDFHDVEEMVIAGVPHTVISTLELLPPCAVVSRFSLAAYQLDGSFWCLFFVVTPKFHAIGWQHRYQRARDIGSECTPYWYPLFVCSCLTLDFYFFYSGPKFGRICRNTPPFGQAQD
jgi:hypothetical protein